jgi:hypothetical protein
MKKRDFLAGFCCGAFIARAAGLDLSRVYQIFAVALVVLALISLWEWIKKSIIIREETNRNIIINRLQKHTSNFVITENTLKN